tara:strand:- start:876 stop:1241 length:366 start_codon:yes stop_codon:yes gene_type:complete
LWRPLCQFVNCPSKGTEVASQPLGSPLSHRSLRIEVDNVRAPTSDGHPLAGVPDGVTQVINGPVRIGTNVGVTDDPSSVRNVEASPSFCLRDASEESGDSERGTDEDILDVHEEVSLVFGM